MAYLPNSADDRQEMLTALGVANPADLFAEIPAHLQDPKLELPPPLSELELTAEMRRLADANRPLSRWEKRKIKKIKIRKIKKLTVK